MIKIKIIKFRNQYCDEESFGQDRAIEVEKFINDNDIDQIHYVSGTGGDADFSDINAIIHYHEKEE